VVSLINAKGETVAKQEKAVELPAYRRINIPASVILPDISGGYLVLTEFFQKGPEKALKSRRYIRIGEIGNPVFPEILP